MVQSLEDDRTRDGGSRIGGTDQSADDSRDRRDRCISWLLAAVGSFADAGSYVLVGGFTGHVTGNTVLTAIYLVTGRTSLACASVTAVAAFLGGTASGTAWRPAGETQSSRLRWPLVVEIVLIALGLVFLDAMPKLGRFLFVPLACFALGLQNGTLTKLGSVSIHSTYITGISTSLVGATLGHQATKRSVLLQVVAFFVFGAVEGAACVEGLGGAGYSAIFLPLIGALAVAVQAHRRDRMKLPI